MKPSDIELLKLLAAMLGPILTIGVSAWGIVYQLRKNAERENKTRSLNMRRDVYFDAVEAIAGAVSCITKYADIEKPNNLLETNADKHLGHASRASLIVQLETYRVLTDFLKKAVQAQMEIATHRLHAIALKSRADVLSKIAQSLPPGDPRFTHATSDAQVAVVKVGAAQLELLEHALQLVRGLAPLQAKVVCAMRVELETGVDEKAFLEISENQLNASFDEAEKFLRVIRNKIESASSG